MPGLTQQSAIVAAIQQWSPPGSEALARVLSALGGEQFYLLLIPCLLWFAPQVLAVRAARVMVLTDLIGEWIKWTLRWPRPSSQLAIATETSPGFVSTHAALSLGVALILAKDHPKLRPWLALWVLGVGWSRLRLGVHFPLDILGGWILGALIAGLVWRFANDSLGSTATILGVGLLLFILWPEQGGESLQRDLGLLLGLELGLRTRQPDTPALGWPQGLLRLALLLLTYVGLKALDWPRWLRYLALALVAAARQRRRPDLPEKDFG